MIKRFKNTFLMTVLFFALFSMQSASAYTKLGPDRVLLMNNDTNPLCEISYQGYNDTSTQNDHYWVHDSYAGYGMNTYLLKGTNHCYYAKDGTLLWELKNCRAGSATVSGSTRNYIPWSNTSTPLKSTAAKPITDLKQVGSAIMLNTTDAYVYSPYYEDVGTIYFDVVNAFTTDTTGKIALEFATNTISGVKLDGADYTNCNWIVANVDVYEVANNTTVTLSEKDATEVSLKSTASGSKLFYRVVSKFNYDGPFRFRIRRLTSKGSTIGTYFIIIDNIIVSYPPMSIGVAPVGENRGAEGVEVCGLVQEFTTPFIADGQTNAYPRGQIMCVTNSSYAAMGLPLDMSNFIVNEVDFHYRWRYLTQTNEWKTIALDIASGDKPEIPGDPSHPWVLTGTAPVDLSDGVGDIEYYFSLNGGAPHYEIVDFALGLTKPFGDYVEGASVITNKSDVKYSTPAGGFDWFTRIRPGESEFQRVNVLLTWYIDEDDGYTVRRAFTTNSLSLTDDHTWRGYYHVTTNMVGTSVSFAFQGINRQTPGGSSFDYNEKIWYPSVDEITDFPYTSLANGTEENSFVLDGNATYLLFEFNDKGESFTISRASYQNFKAWTDASEGFVGHYMATSGVSDVKFLYDSTTEMQYWPIFSNSNDNWKESFYLNYTTGEQSTFPYNVWFSTHSTPNGWTFDQGKFTTETYNQMSNTTAKTMYMALQLRGQGYGTLSMANLAQNRLPPGLGEVKFRAHLEQSMGMEDVAYSYNYLNASNYAVSAQVAMSVVKNATDISPLTPSISLFAYYRPNEGCYEGRVRRVESSGNNSLELTIYKWLRDTSVSQPAVQLYRKTFNNGGNLLYQTSANTDYKNFTGMMISAYNTSTGTLIRVGLSTRRNTVAISNDTSYISWVQVCDNSSTRLTHGSIGIGSQSCPAYFGAVQHHDMVNAVTPNYVGHSLVNEMTIGRDWDYDIRRYGKMEYNTIAAKNEVAQWVYGLKALTPTQSVEVLLQPYGSTKGWESYGFKTNIYSFAWKDYSVEPRIADRCYVRLATGGTEDDLRTDVVIDNIEANSWSGNSGPSSTYPADEWAYMQACVQTNKVLTQHHVTLQPARAVYGTAQGIRSPLLDKSEGGLSMFSFSVTNVKAGASILLQIATNYVDGVNKVNSSSLPVITDTVETDGDITWTTLTNYTWTADDPRGGTFTRYIGIRAPVLGAVRLICDTNLVKFVNENRKLPVDYGQLTIYNAYCYDEPAIDERSWWGWNLWTTGWNPDGTPTERGYLTDSPNGLSCALNFTGLATEQTIGEFHDKENIESYGKNDPFVQSPKMEKGIGQVQFRARKFDAASAEPSIVTLLASGDPGAGTEENPNEGWTVVTNFVVDAKTYKTFLWKSTNESSQYTVIRLAVNGARLGRNSPEAAATPIQRVMIDEVVVSEPVSPRLKFVNVFPFRSNISDDTVYVTNVTEDVVRNEQPLTGEGWGLQCALQSQQMLEEINLDSIEVKFAYYKGLTPWGAEQWLNDSSLSDKVISGTLKRVGTNLVWRSSYDHAGSIFAPVSKGNTTVQFMLWAEYDDANGQHHTHPLEPNEWTSPSWYWPLDYNASLGGADKTKFAGYTILDAVSPKRAWFNEINIWDGKDSLAVKRASQFIEVAVPSGADMNGWYMTVQASPLVKASFASFGSSPATRQKIDTIFNDDNTPTHYAFVTFQSPEGTRTDTDGKWWAPTETRVHLSNGSFNVNETYALELVRPSGIVEHQIVVAGTNYYAGTDYEYLGSGTNLVAKVKEIDYPGSTWFFTGNDHAKYTRGVILNHGEDEDCWVDCTTNTVGGINKSATGEIQYIDQHWFLTPNGTNVWITAAVSASHVTQTIAGETNNRILMILPIGTETNIVYNVGAWYQLAAITHDGVDKETPHAEGTYTYTFKAERDTVIDVVEAPSERTVEKGLDPASPYVPAVLDWLQQFDSSKDIKLAKYINLADEEVRDLSLLEMYWLDINPVDGDWIFKAGAGKPSYLPRDMAGRPHVIGEEYVKSAVSDTTITNVDMAVMMMISNATTDVSSPLYGQAHPPYTLRGLKPGSHSGGTGYPGDGTSWTSAVFMVEGALQNGRVNNVFLPLKWMVFGPDSFKSATDPVEPFCAHVVFALPFDTRSPGYHYGWTKWIGTQVFYRWSIGPIDGTAVLDTIELLKTE